MKLRTSVVVSVILGLLAVGDAAAQKISLRIDNGQVTLDAQNVTLEEILARWMDATGLNIISKTGEGSDVRVSLHLESVPEREALAAVLRDLSGYIMGERRDPQTGVVTVDRLMILPQSADQGLRQPLPPQRAAAEIVSPLVEEPRVDETPRELAPMPSLGEDWGPRSAAP